MDLVERTRRISVFSADVEAAEGHIARGVATLWVSGCVLAGLLLVCLAIGRPSQAVLAVGMAVTAVASLAAAAAGWYVARSVVKSVLSKGGAVAAFAARFGWWRRSERRGSWRLLADRVLWSPGLGACDDVPPGMTYDEWAAGRKKADRFLRKILAVGVGGSWAWMLGVVGAGAYVAVQRSAGFSWGIPLVAGSIPVFCAAPAGWLLCWRRYRDEVARAAATDNMNAFMEARGWTWGPMHLWRRAGDPE